MMNKGLVLRKGTLMFNRGTNGEDILTKLNPYIYRCPRSNVL